MCMAGTHEYRGQIEIKVKVHSHHSSPRASEGSLGPEASSTPYDPMVRFFLFACMSLLAAPVASLAAVVPLSPSSAVITDSIDGNASKRRLTSSKSFLLGSNQSLDWSWPSGGAIEGSAERVRVRVRERACGCGKESMWVRKGVRVRVARKKVRMRGCTTFDTAARTDKGDVITMARQR